MELFEILKETFALLEAQDSYENAATELFRSSPKKNEKGKMYRYMIFI